MGDSLSPVPSSPDAPNTQSIPSSSSFCDLSNSPDSYTTLNENSHRYTRGTGLIRERGEVLPPSPSSTEALRPTVRPTRVTQSTTRVALPTVLHVREDTLLKTLPVLLHTTPAPTHVHTHLRVLESLSYLRLEYRRLSPYHVKSLFVPLGPELRSQTPFQGPEFLRSSSSIISKRMKFSESPFLSPSRKISSTPCMVGSVGSSLGEMHMDTPSSIRVSQLVLLMEVGSVGRPLRLEVTPHDLDSSRWEGSVVMRWYPVGFTPGVGRVDDVET